ncbi:MAG: Fe-S protein assembly co-chaperone HscB [Planctomycetota bacterium]|nr:MAG: Fe-S protein assembly co-chaperone HscB [Planctomycetota bacterium]
MSDKASPTRPTHCIDCAKPMESPICCTHCGSLNPVPLVSINYFEFFDIKPGYDINQDELHKKYLCLSRTTHPDMAGRDSDEMRNRALMLNAELNRAYETLKDPIERAEYLLALAGGPTPSDDKSVPGDLLGEIMMIREEIEEAKSTNKTPMLETLKNQICQKERTVREQIAVLARSLDKNDPTNKKAMRKQLNAIKYWNNLLEQLPTG